MCRPHFWLELSVPETGLTRSSRRVARSSASGAHALPPTERMPLGVAQAPVSPATQFRSLATWAVGERTGATDAEASALAISLSGPMGAWAEAPCPD
eukprot:9495641-Pyramimonas_sp.AAC.2